MGRTLGTLVVGIGLGISGFSLANNDEHEKEHAGMKRKIISEQDVVETLNGKEAHVSMIEVTFGPGDAGGAHRHPGPVYGYVLEGEYELGFNDKPAKVLKTGETFYEPAGTLHRVSRNPSTKNRARILAVMVHPRDAKELSVPEPEPKK